MVQRLPRQNAEKLLRRCLEEGEVIRSKHFIEELAAEGMRFVDALFVLRTGTIYDEPEPDIRTAEWKYRIEGQEPGGKYTVIVFAFKTVDRTLLITVFSVESRRKK